MTNHKKELGMNTVARYDLRDSTEVNFNKYQDILEQHPEARYENKLIYDQYLKSVPLHAKEQKVIAEHSIEFDVVGS